MRNAQISHKDEFSVFGISVQSALHTVHIKMTKSPQKQCDRCSALVDQTKSRMVILDRRAPELQERVTVEASTGPSYVSSVSETGEIED